MFPDEMIRRSHSGLLLGNQGCMECHGIRSAHDLIQREILFIIKSAFSPWWIAHDYVQAEAARPFSHDTPYVTFTNDSERRSILLWHAVKREGQAQL